MSPPPRRAGVPAEPRGGRTRDAEASRRALLRAAQTLFGQKGFEATTIREIGERAGVDGSLIARYFGSKADLYVAAVVAEGQEDEPPREYERLEEMARAMLARSTDRGPGPITQAMIRSDTTTEIRLAAQSHLARRLVEPLAAGLAERGVDRPRLRAEIAVSALIGVTVGRTFGWFEELRGVPTDDLVELIAETLGSTFGTDDGGPGW